MMEIEMPRPLLFALKTGKPRPDAVETQTESTFNGYFLTEKKRLYNFILKSVGFSEDANDIYQETALRAFKYFRKFNPSRNFRAWIFSIAINEIRKYFRNRHRTIAADSLESSFMQIPDKKSNELAEAVYSVAFRLGVTEREVFFLFYDSGFSVFEIAEMTGLKSGYVKVILSNARKKIREFLGAVDE